MNPADLFNGIILTTNFLSARFSSNLQFFLVCLEKQDELEKTDAIKLIISSLKAKAIQTIQAQKAIYDANGNSCGFEHQNSTSLYRPAPANRSGSLNAPLAFCLFKSHPPPPRRCPIDRLSNQKLAVTYAAPCACWYLPVGN